MSLISSLSNLCSCVALAENITWISIGSESTFVFKKKKIVCINRGYLYDCVRVDLPGVLPQSLCRVPDELFIFEPPVTWHSCVPFPGCCVYTPNRIHSLAHICLLHFLLNVFFFFFVYYFLKLGRGFAALIIPLAVTSELTVFKAWNTCPLVNISILSRFFFPGTVVNYHDICKNSCFLQACLVLYICMNSSQDPFKMFHLNILHLFM